MRLGGTQTPVETRKKNFFSFAPLRVLWEYHFLQFVLLKAKKKKRNVVTYFVWIAK